MREFKIGQYVFYQRHKAEGRFIVIRSLPQPKREPRYIIRSALMHSPPGRLHRLPTLLARYRVATRSTPFDN